LQCLNKIRHRSLSIEKETENKPENLWRFEEKAVSLQYLNKGKFLQMFEKKLVTKTGECFGKPIKIRTFAVQ
jgi:hypothetical protein